MYMAGQINKHNTKVGWLLDVRKGKLMVPIVPLEIVMGGTVLGTCVTVMAKVMLLLWIDNSCGRNVCPDPDWGTYFFRFESRSCSRSEMVIVPT
jgi:hypothetical protein